MLKDQLEEIRKTRKTFLHKKHHMLKFIDDDDIDAESLLGLVKIDTPYTKEKSLRFDRHRLSKKEEIKFNKKFSNFLKSLISKMKNENIRFLLEYLVRIYSIDTFNQSEIIFLLTPFEEYFSQLQVISSHYKGVFDGMKEYSIPVIARLTIKYQFLFLNFVEYFKYFNYLENFLCKMIDEMKLILNSGSENYLGEFYEIFTILIEQNKKDTALKIFQNLKKYLDSDEFIELFRLHFTEEEIFIPEIQIISMNKFEEAYNLRSGRKYLSDILLLKDYIIFLQEKNLVPNEFTEKELNLINSVIFGKKYENNSAKEFIEFYKEIKNKIFFTKVLCNFKDSYLLVPYMDEESLIYYIKLENNFKIEILTNENHKIILKNISKDIFYSNYEDILRICIEFSNFVFEIFDSFVFIFSDSDISKINLIKLAEFNNVDIKKIILEEHLNNIVFISYILNSKTKLNIKNYSEILEFIKNNKNGNIVNDFSNYLEVFGAKSQITLFIEWALENGFGFYVANLAILKHKFLPEDFLEEIFFKSNSIELFKIIIKRNKKISIRLFEEQTDEIIIELINTIGIDKILINTKECYDFIKKHKKELNLYKDEIIIFLSNYPENEYSLECLFLYYDDLIRFRNVKNWNYLKTI